MNEEIISWYFLQGYIEHDDGGWKDKQRTKNSVKRSKAKIHIFEFWVLILPSFQNGMSMECRTMMIMHAKSRFELISTIMYFIDWLKDFSSLFIAQTHTSSPSVLILVLLVNFLSSLSMDLRVKMGSSWWDKHIRCHANWKYRIANHFKDIQFAKWDFLKYFFGDLKNFKHAQDDSKTVDQKFIDEKPNKKTLGEISCWKINAFNVPEVNFSLLFRLFCWFL